MASALACLLAACAGDPPAVAPVRLSAAVGGALQACEALPARFAFEQTGLASAVRVAAGPLTGALAQGFAVISSDAVYSNFPWDPGIAAANWAQWKFVNDQVLDPAAGFIFMTPPRPLDPFKVDIEDGLNAVYATSANFGESADAAISMPGMAHCSGGPATDQFDPLTPLVRWVEQGVAPEALRATARGAGNAGGVNAELPAGWAPARSRPLCPWPQVARYKGGDLDSAESFRCEAP